MPRKRRNLTVPRLGWGLNKRMPTKHVASTVPEPKEVCNGRQAN